jgi:hypothetical protein
VTDPVARQARVVAAAFRQKQMKEIADMIDYLADAADKQWDAITADLKRERTP